MHTHFDVFVLSTDILIGAFVHIYDTFCFLIELLSFGLQNIHLVVSND